MPVNTEGRKERFIKQILMSLGRIRCISDPAGIHVDQISNGIGIDVNIRIRLLHPPFRENNRQGKLQ